jgi:hypothetical protein
MEKNDRKYFFLEVLSYIFNALCCPAIYPARREGEDISFNLCTQGVALGWNISGFQPF